MNTMTKKFLPMGTIVLIMAFFLTGCDAVLETFYPALTDANSKFASKSVSLELSYDKSLKGPIVVALVPYDEQNGYSVPADKSRWNIQRDTTGSGLFKVNFALDGVNGLGKDKSYKLIAFNNDPNNPNGQYDTVDKPNKDLKEATLIEIGFSWDGKFTVADVTSDTYYPYLGKSTQLDIGLYNELFPSATGSGVWLTMPQKVNTDTTLDQFKLSRVYDYKGMSPISEIYVVINWWDGNVYAAYDSRLISVGAADQYNMDIPFFDNGNPFTFSAAGDYEIQVYYKENETYSSGQSFYVFVGDADGYAEGNNVQLSVTLDWSYANATQGYLYYTDGYSWGNWIYVTSSDGTLTFNVPYMPGAHLYLDAYDAGGNFVYGYTSEFDNMVQTPLQGVPSSYNGYDPYSIYWTPNGPI